MADALIGGTGLVGGTLLRHRRFDAVYRSTTIEEIAGRRFDRIYCAGAPAEKWKANRDPDADWRNLERLLAAVTQAEARLVVLISTVDVFGEPRGVTEDDVPTGATAYGRHRLELERVVAAKFPTLVVRLPALFGPGLRKNAVYDLLHGNQIEKIDSRGRFQFYDLERLAGDLEVAERAELRLVHCATEPVTVERMARDAFGIPFINELPPAPASYDMHTRHAAVFGRPGPYLSNADETLAAMQRFVNQERETRRCG